ncbi:3037_t:CDS:1 [Acaulospora morrowiae]|uniref:3037_t:CDS:1 n=1 Tax=Acaulospora morrowiae TaxID=94023 RepID=A0A9N9CSU0_9GLOM|nr:3037_t:CDS:1 [Acaulospora morrowiae]
MDNRKELYDSIIVKVPYPPTVTAEDLFNLRKPTKNGKPPSKVSNSFMVYRGEFYKELRKTHRGIPQYVVSRVASNSWKLEPKQVKEKYLKIARDLDMLFLESSEKANFQFQSLLLTPVASNLDLSYSQHPISQEFNPDLPYIQGKSPTEKHTLNVESSQDDMYPYYIPSQYESFLYQEAYTNYFCQENLDLYTSFTIQPEHSEQIYCDVNLNLY